MKLLTLFICFPFFCHSTDIVIPLSDDNIVEPKRYTFFTDFEAKVDSEGHLYSVQKVSENIQGALSLSDFIVDINKYQVLSESMVTVNSLDEVKISFDDNLDKDFTNDREPIITEINTKVNSYFEYAHIDDADKNIRVPCTYVVMFDNEDYMVKIFFQTKSTGKFNIDEKVYNLSFWKNLYTDIKINNSRVPLNNPIRINRKFYQIREYNPVENCLTLYLLENQTNLTGTLQGLYVDKKKLEDAFTHHGIMVPTNLDKTQYHVFYFWGHWCPPCLKSMPETCKTLNGLDDKFSIYNISLDSEYSVENVQTITDITNNYEIPGLPIIEYHSKTSKSQNPIIELLGNISYPSIIICDKNLKIIYRSDRNDKSLEEILSELEN